MKAPSNQNRIAVIGRTGSGKTHFSMWLLGSLLQDSWSDMPLTIFDFKRAKFIRRLLDAKVAKKIDINRKPPKEPGIYIVQPEPVADDMAVLDYLKAIYLQESHCLYFDEAYELGIRNRGFRRLLTQGRELEIPMLYCTQRPVNCDRYSLSEADYMAIFKLRIEDDQKLIRNMVPQYDPARLVNYECFWYDVGSDEGVKLRPVPSETEIMRLYTGEVVQAPMSTSAEPIEGRSRVFL